MEVDVALDVSRLYPIGLIIETAENSQRRIIALPQYISLEDFSLLVSAAFEAPNELGINAIQDELTEVVYPIAALLENPSAFSGDQKFYKMMMASSFYRDKKKKKGMLNTHTIRALIVSR